METNSSLGGQLAEMINAIKYYSVESTKSQKYDLTFVTLIWPLLPLMPPEPPKPVLELFKEPEICDVCGIAERQPLLKCTKSTTGVLKPLITEESLRLRFPSSTKMPLDKYMHEIEMKIDETLNSIESTTKRTDELKEQTKELPTDVTDEEIIRRLNSLEHEKAAHERRVKDLEAKEKELKESLMMAINWAKGIEASGKRQKIGRKNE